MNNLLSKYLKKFDNIPSYLIVIFLIYTLTTYFIWKKYEFEPTSMVHFWK